MNEEYLKLPKYLLEISIKNSNEYGWRQNDVLAVITAARAVSLATLGGQVQYIIPAGTYELYWLSYDSTADQKVNEDWLTFCDRSANECSEKFKQLISTDIESEAISSFPEILTNNLITKENLKEYKVFILYFADKDSHY